MNIVFDFKIFLQQNYGGPSRYFFNLFEHINQRNDEYNAFIISPIYYNEYLNSSNFKDKIIGTKIPKIKFTGIFSNKINRLLCFLSVGFRNVPVCGICRESSTLSVLIIPLFLRSTEWLFAVTNTSIPFSLHDFAKASGEENCGYPEYGGPANVTSRFAIVISARLIIGLIF